MFKPLTTIVTDKLSLPPKNGKYFKWVSRETCLAREEIYLTYLLRQGVKEVIDIPNGDVYDHYVEEKSGRKTFEKIGKALIKNWPRHIATYENRKRKLIFAAKQTSGAALTGNRARTLASYKKYIRQAFEFSEYIHGAWGVIFYIEPLIAKKLGRKLGAVSALTRPIEFIKMKRDLHRLAKRRLISRYAWLNVYNPHDQPYSDLDFLKLGKLYNKQDVRREFANLQKNKTLYKNVLKQIDNPLFKRQAEIIHAYAFLKTDRVDAWKQAMHNLTPFYEFISRLAEYSLFEAVQLSTAEVVNLLQTGQTPPRKNLRLRGRKKSLFYFQKNLLTVFSGRIGQIRTVLENSGQNKTALSGTSASRGRAKGAVKIINSSKDLHKVKRGDIFVAKYTFPTFTPAMAKSAAVVTDEGGITSHAAIVSRELGIPCIVGAANATSILHDGDIVEVDANTGVVKKLKR